MGVEDQAYFRNISQKTFSINETFQLNNFMCTLENHKEDLRFQLCNKIHNWISNTESVQISYDNILNYIFKLKNVHVFEKSARAVYKTVFSRKQLEYSIG